MKSQFREYSFEKLDAWRVARDLSNIVYGVSRSFPDEEKFGLKSQLRRSAISVVSNLAESLAS
ncbi:MAG: four helix bundle protein, partial [Bacteroidota bacterium]